MGSCNLSLPCTQTSAFVFEISTAEGDIANAIVGNCDSGVGISGNALNAAGTAIGIGVSGTAQNGNGGEFQSGSAVGVTGASQLAKGGNPEFQGIGVQGTSIGGTAVQATSTGGTGVLGTSIGGTAGLFTNSIAEDLTENNNAALVAGTTGTGGAAYFHIDNVSSFATTLEAQSAGLGGAAYFHNDNKSSAEPALTARAGGANPAGYFLNPNGANDPTVVALSPSSGGKAGMFYGAVDVSGTLQATTKNFIIDHPLDPGNRYLVHTSIESSEQACLYSGNVVLNNKGEAVVNLPIWVEALNEDFRYQLTCVGLSAPVFIAEQVANNQFGIAGGAPGMKVSWQLIGIRKDAWAKAFPLVVEQDKLEEEKGHFRHPELFGSDQKHSIAHLRAPRVPKLS